jgi:hypothetical protein
MLFSNFGEVTRGKLGNPYQFPKISMVSHELTSLMQQPLISKAITPLDWIKMHPKSVPSSFLGASTPTRNVRDRGRSEGLEYYLGYLRTTTNTPPRFMVEP